MSVGEGHSGVARRIPFWTLNGVMLFLFFLSIVVQYNDDEGTIWMFIYGYAFIVTAMAFHTIPLALAAFGTAAYLLAAYIHYPILHQPFIESEEAREAGGLALCGLYMLVLTIIGGIQWVRTREHKAANP